MAEILLVEPNADLRMVQAVALGGAGHRVQATASFEAARCTLTGTFPDVLVTAVRLGAFNGLHLIIRARAVRPRLAAVLTTPAPDPALEREARAHGAALVVAGADPEALGALVDALLIQPIP